MEHRCSVTWREPETLIGPWYVALSRIVLSFSWWCNDGWGLDLELDTFVLSWMTILFPLQQDVHVPIYPFLLGLGKDGFTDILPGVHSMDKCHFSSLKGSTYTVRNNFSVSIKLSVLHSLCYFLPSSKKSSHLKRGIGQIIFIQLKKRKKSM